MMETCTSLTKKVLALEEAKTAQDRVITILKLRVKRLEKKRKARTPQPMKRRLFKGRVETSTDKSLGEEDASKQGRESDKTKSMFQDSDFDVLDDDMEDKTAILDEDLVISQTLIKMKEEKAKEKGVSIKDVEDSPRLIRSITTLQPLPTIDSKDKGKGVLVEEEPEKPEKGDVADPIADGSSKNYKIFSEMLNDFDRQDVIDLHRLVNERYETTSPEGYDLLLWGDLKTLFEPNKEDEIWKNQQDYNLIS
ncbi:hypothetical protein Tco_1295408 [Tanacetum coccineum]